MTETSSMEAPHPTQSHGPDEPPPTWLRESLNDAIRFWEPRRLVYNLVLGAVAVAWLVATWPHFRPAFTLWSLLRLAILASLANVCYCAAYLVDIPMQLSAFSAAWRRRRWALWLSGTLLAVLMANYWIADEIYPFVQQSGVSGRLPIDRSPNWLIDPAAAGRQF